jgi:hypothetical protein
MCAFENEHAEHEVGVTDKGIYFLLANRRAKVPGLSSVVESTMTKMPMPRGA